MRFKIGFDLGVVLAKGVFISMLCTFTILPALILLIRVYRLDKIERATGLNIRKFSDAVTFRLITILYKILK